MYRKCVFSLIEIFTFPHAPAAGGRIFTFLPKAKGGEKTGAFARKYALSPVANYRNFTIASSLFW